VRASEVFWRGRCACLRSVLNRSLCVPKKCSGEVAERASDVFWRGRCACLRRVLERSLCVPQKCSE
jgi:hypothetical protein